MRLAYERTGADGRSDIWIRDLTRGDAMKLAGTPGTAGAPTWTPDGRELLFSTEQSFFEIFRVRADFSRPAVQFSTSGGGDKRVSQVTADGRLAVLVHGSGPKGELWTARLDGSEPAQRWLASDASLTNPVISPDGRWIAYDGTESGKVEVYIQSWPDPAGARRQISSGGASEPLWTKGGRELVYRTGDSVMAVTIDPTSGAASAPALLFSGRYLTGFGSRNRDATPDGEHFFLVKLPPELQARQIKVVLNWLDELRVKVPTR
jgi:Tol biopolymer transport system component